MAKLNTKDSIRKLAQHPAISKPLVAYSKKEYATLLFVFRETLAGFAKHNIMGLSASLSFYALFALIPLVLLIFYLLSHLVFSSDYAIVKLAILTSNIMPDFSGKIMTEVYKASNSKAAWGALGLFILLWTITPLARAMRSSFYNISSIVEQPSFLKGKLRDILSVLGILLLFFTFTAAGFIVEEIVRFLAVHLPKSILSFVGGSITLVVTTSLIALFYKMFFPMRVALRHIFIGALLTALLWVLMRPAFGLFLSINPDFGAVFGSMKNMFVSITWLYVNFAVFLLGSVLIATLRKQDALLLRGLFDDVPDKDNYIEALMQRYGITMQQHEHVFEIGNTGRSLYYLVSGEVHLTNDHGILRKINAGNYFGETASLTEQPTTTNAMIVSPEARIIVIHAENIDAMLTDNPKVAMHLLKQLAARIEKSST
ncbi:MAG: YhjD/YihY/BrkB family envelope integrity protein [Methylophilaceae bacterium]